jgi:hypothetical protein
MAILPTAEELRLAMDTLSDLTRLIPDLNRLIADYADLPRTHIVRHMSHA